MAADVTAETDELRSALRGMWASVASNWGDHADYVEARGAAVTAALLARTRPSTGDRVLELACGTGDVGLAAGSLVQPGGKVVLSDAVAEMVEIAARRAGATMLDDVSTRVLDLEAIDEPDGSFDVVLCREGLMFATDPGRATREIARVLAPGGRVAIAVWGPRARNPWLGLVLDAVSDQIGTPVPPPGIPGPFALGDAAGLHTLFADAGLADIAVDELAAPTSAASFDEWWQRTTALAGPLSNILPSLPDEVQQAIRDRVRTTVAPYETDAGIELPGLTLIASARRRERTHP